MLETKIYVEVDATFTQDGRLLPRNFVWEDGRRITIDRVTDCRRAASLKAGGVGQRYTCIVDGSRHYLYYEGDNRWFMERTVL